MKPASLLTSLLLIMAPAMIRAEPETVSPESFSVGAFQFQRPEGWNWIPAGGMRKAQLQIPGAAGKPVVDITFFHFGPGQGGGVDSNVKRWLGQFAEPQEKLGAEIAKAEIDGTAVTFVRAKGTFNSGMPGSSTTPMADFALVGAILESSEGDVFVKMTGPAEAVNAAVPAFEGMIHKAVKK